MVVNEKASASNILLQEGKRGCRCIRYLARIKKEVVCTPIFPLCSTMLFDNHWFDSASKKSHSNQWVDDVMHQINGAGGIYLNTLRLWFERFPVSKKQKKHLKNRIESFNNADHLGGVNEIVWWEFANSFGWTAKPIREVSASG